MAKTILIPIDFKIESLNTLKFSLYEQSEKVNVVLLHGHYLSNSITDLLFYSPEKTISEIMSVEFKQALDHIKNRFEHLIEKIEINFLHAYNPGLLENVLRHYHVDRIYVSKNYKAQPPREGFDTVSLLKDSSIPVYEIQWANSNFQTERVQVEHFFNSENQANAHAN